MNPDAELDGREEVMMGFAEEAAETGGFFFYVKIPGNIVPLERGDLFEDALERRSV